MKKENVNIHFGRQNDQLCGQFCFRKQSKAFRASASAHINAIHSKDYIARQKSGSLGSRTGLDLFNMDTKDSGKKINEYLIFIIRRMPRSFKNSSLKN